MRGGHLRHRVTRQMKSESRDSHGGVTYTWADGESRWAEVTTLQGRELWQARQAGLFADVKVSTRYWPELTNQDRLSFGARVLNIESVIDVQGRGIESVALCVQKQ